MAPYWDSPKSSCLTSYDQVLDRVFSKFYEFKRRKAMTFQILQRLRRILDNFQASRLDESVGDIVLEYVAILH